MSFMHCRNRPKMKVEKLQLRKKRITIRTVERNVLLHHRKIPSWASRFIRWTRSELKRRRSEKKTNPNKTTGDIWNSAGFGSSSTNVSVNALLSVRIKRAFVLLFACGKEDAFLLLLLFLLHWWRPRITSSSRSTRNPSSFSTPTHTHRTHTRTRSLRNTGWCVHPHTSSTHAFFI